MKRNVLLQATCVIILLSACSKKSVDPTPTPPKSPELAIASLDVNSGIYNTKVKITGSGFSTTVSEDQIFFNGHTAFIETASKTEIIADVPLGAGTGAVTVTVNGKTATGPVFTYQLTEVVTSLAGDLNRATFADGKGVGASFNTPSGLATDNDGNLYVADQRNNLIRKVTPDGTVTTIAGNGQNGYQDGDSKSASFGSPAGVAIDASGNIFVADSDNGLIRKITPNGQVSTFAGHTKTNVPTDGTGQSAGFLRPMDIVADAFGNLFVMDQGVGQVRKITSSGVVTTVCKNISGYQLVLDKDANIYVADESSGTICKITQAGKLSVFAGDTNVPFGSLDGTGTNASFYQPRGITIDGSGNLLVADVGNRLIRKITPDAVVSVFGSRAGQNQYGPITAVNFGGVAAITVDKTGVIYFIVGSEIRKISMQ